MKLIRQHSHKAKHKKRQKHNARHEKKNYLETTKLEVLKTPRCNVGCQSYKIDVRNELCSVCFISFDKIEVKTCMPRIYEKVTPGERFLK